METKIQDIESIKFIESHSNEVEKSYPTNLCEEIIKEFIKLKIPLINECKGSISGAN